MLKLGVNEKIEMKEWHYMFNKVPSSSPNLTEENIEVLKQLFPEIVTDGEKINFDKLKVLLGESVDTGREKYEFTWPGKQEMMQGLQVPSKATLKVDEQSSKNMKKTKNLYIEGDNLEVLKTLQKSYHNKIKLIYIDPPYNTGEEFIYSDDYSEKLDNYLSQTGQVSEEGYKTKSSLESSGKKHSKWLNMLYSRLKLAKNLLADDGAIFVNIDYNESANLKKMMDEIFGENNFQREIIWRIGWISGYKSIAPNFIRNHDTIYFYSKSPQDLDFKKMYIENKDFKPLVKMSKEVKKKLSELNLNNQQQQDLLNFINYENRPDKYPLEDTWNSNEYDNLNSIAITSFTSEKISKILNIDLEFKGQKSVKLLKRIIMSIANKEDTILDFFSGTASTAHAVMKLNAEDGGNRQFIMVQLPEPTDEKSEAYKAGYKNICEIGKERIRRAGEQILEEHPEAADRLDVGFKVLKLDSSNIREWNVEFDQLEDEIDLFADTFVDGAREIDIVHEIMLKTGLELTLPIDTFEVDGKNIYDIAYGNLFICLADEINEAVVRAIIKRRRTYDIETSTVVLKDTGFANNDSEKLNCFELLKDAGYQDDQLMTI